MTPTRGRPARDRREPAAVPVRRRDSIDLNRVAPSSTAEPTPREADASHHTHDPTMTPDRSPSRRTDHPDPTTGPHPSEPLPSRGAMTAFAALPVVTVAALSFPTASAVALAALCGAVVGATLHRRHPDAVERTFRLPDDDRAAREA